jgi:hypothetical protein
MKSIEIQHPDILFINPVFDKSVFRLCYKNFVVGRGWPWSGRDRRVEHGSRIPVAALCARSDPAERTLVLQDKII